MDPLSVLHIAGTAASAAKGAWSIGEALYTFFSDVRKIDHTVSGMVAEVRALSSACCLVDERLRVIVRDFEGEVRSPRAGSSKLWSCIEVQVAESQQSVAQLHAALETVRNEGPNQLAQAWRQIKLNMRTNDIDEARNRIRSHTAALQTILQTVAIEVCYLAPQRADQQLRTLVSGVEQCMLQLKALREERGNANLFGLTNESKILEMGSDAASNGESLYAESVANGSIPDFGTLRQKGGTIDQWMADLTAIEEVGGQATPDNLDLHSTVSTSEISSTGRTDDTTFRESRTTVTATDYNDPDFTSQQADETFDDSDDEFQIEIAQEALAAARTSFQQKDFSETNSYLEEALKMVRQLPTKQQSICDTWEIRYMLSVCAYHSNNPADAEAKLLSVLDSSSRSEKRSKEQLRQVCETGHLLSRLYVQIDNLEHARLYCDNALQGRRRLLGKSHDDTYASMALMARINQLQGSDSRAKIFLRLIDETKKDRLWNEVASLGVSTAMLDAYKKAQLPNSSDHGVASAQTASEQATNSSSLAPSRERETPRTAANHRQKHPVSNVDILRGLQGSGPDSGEPATASSVSLGGPGIHNSQRVRTWTTRDPTFTVEAECVGLRDGKAILYKTNGVKIVIPTERMSDDDLEYLRREHYPVRAEIESRDRQNRGGGQGEVASDFSLLALGTPASRPLGSNAHTVNTDETSVQPCQPKASYLVVLSTSLGPIHLEVRPKGVSNQPEAWTDFKAKVVGGHFNHQKIIQRVEEEAPHRVFMMIVYRLTNMHRWTLRIALDQSTSSTWEFTLCGTNKCVFDGSVKVGKGVEDLFASYRPGFGTKASAFTWHIEES